MRDWPKKITIKIIKFYRNYMSCIMIRCCRFHPSCSEYAMEAIEKYGFFQGGIKAIMRILRCHPFSAGGYDPVA